MELEGHGKSERGDCEVFIAVSMIANEFYVKIIREADMSKSLCEEILLSRKYNMFYFVDEKIYANIHWLYKLN